MIIVLPNITLVTREVCRGNALGFPSLQTKGTTWHCKEALSCKVHTFEYYLIRNIHDSGNGADRLWDANPAWFRNTALTSSALLDSWFLVHPIEHVLPECFGLVNHRSQIAISLVTYSAPAFSYQGLIQCCWQSWGFRESIHESPHLNYSYRSPRHYHLEGGLQHMVGGSPLRRV